MNAVEQTVRWLGALALGVALVLAAAGGIRATSVHRGRAEGLARWIGAGGSYLVSGVPYLALCILLWRPVPVEPSDEARATALVAGLVFGAAGWTLYVWGRLALGRMYNVSSSLGSELFTEHRLVTTGPFRFVRHPMYLGIVLGAAGALLIYRTWTAMFVVLALPGLAVKAHREERLLEAEFGDLFRAYRARVPAWFPGLRGTPRDPTTHGLPRSEGGPG